MTNVTENGVVFISAASSLSLKVAFLKCFPASFETIFEIFINLKFNILYPIYER